MGPISQAGEAVHRLPPGVAWLRICHDPTSAAASYIPG